MLYLIGTMQTRRCEMDDLIQVTMWRVTGIDGVYYPTKARAMTAAREAFPDEDAVACYTRLFYKTFYMEA